MSVYDRILLRRKKCAFSGFLPAGENRFTVNRMPEPLPSSPASPDPIQSGVDWLAGALAQCQAPHNVTAVVQAGRQHYGERMFALILHTSGLQLGEAQRTISRACTNWQQALHLSGRNPQSLMGEVAGYQPQPDPPAA